jgi:hypothetical protein
MSMRAGILTLSGSKNMCLVWLVVRRSKNSTAGLADLHESDGDQHESEEHRVCVTTAHSRRAQTLRHVHSERVKMHTLMPSRGLRTHTSAHRPR